jgi:hypothetical protein
VDGLHKSRLVHLGNLRYGICSALQHFCAPHHAFALATTAEFRLPALGRPLPLPRRRPLEIDSNTVERPIRPIALNRKNALFAGSDGGAEHWAVIASLIETCKLNNVEPLGYLVGVLTRIDGHPNSGIDDLLPWYATKLDL